MPTSAVTTFGNANRLDPAYATDDLACVPVGLIDGTYVHGQVLAERVGTNAVRTLTMSGSPTGGTFKLTWGGQQTGAIAYNATAATVAAALNALSSVKTSEAGPDNVAVTGSAGGPYTVTFINDLADAPEAAFTIDNTLLTGGTTPALADASATVGVAGTKLFGAYTPGNTDGLQTAKGILQYDCVVAAGVMTLAGEWGAMPVNVVPMYIEGPFRTQDLLGLDAVAVEQMSGALPVGDLANGIFKF